MIWSIVLILRFARGGEKGLSECCSVRFDFFYGRGSLRGFVLGRGGGKGDEGTRMDGDDATSPDTIMEIRSVRARRKGGGGVID